MQTIIQKNLVLQRWDALPQEILDAMSSDKNAEALERIYINLHIPSDKQKFVVLVVSYVFMGFIHIEDMAKEIEGAIAINSLHARELADAITQNIFAPYRDLLETIYTGKIAEPTRPSMDTIRPPEQKPAAGPRPLASFAVAPVVAPLPSASPAGAPSGPKPPPVGGLTPIVSPKFTVAPSPLPTLGAVPIKPATPLTTPPPPAGGPAPIMKPAPAPFMIHAETKVQPVVQQAPKFTMESLGKAVSAFSGRTDTSMAPPKLAQVEIGEAAMPKPTGIIGKYETAPRVIHYSDLSTPLPKEMSATSGPVSFGSLRGTPTAPKPATLPVAAMPPAPKSSVPPSGRPMPSGAGGFIKTLITPKNEQPSTPIAAPVPTPLQR